MMDTSVMQERIGELCGQFKLPTVAAEKVGRAPPLATAMPCPPS